VVEALALAMQGSLMQRHAAPAAAEAFCASRLSNRGSGRALGALSAGIDTAPLVARAALEA
jgi:putative acyl-CoA dehydrogenase